MIGFPLLFSVADSGSGAGGSRLEGGGGGGRGGGDEANPVF